MIKIRERNGQEEIVGFVIIVVIVAVVLSVVLGVYIRQEAPITKAESKDVSQFLDSAMEYTSECTNGIGEYFSVEELIRECYYDSKCNGASSCDMLTRTLQEMIDFNWKIGEDKPFKGYMFNASYSSANKEEILLIKKGLCATEKIGAEHLSPATPGAIISILEICS
ncbi:hypothetical protein J4229_03445 [Candidatus Pacearchaeota archaeon]|nr:hypothetical protein [Candidatus Pacearchaeota archaeon]